MDLIKIAQILFLDSDSGLVRVDLGFNGLDGLQVEFEPGPFSLDSGLGCLCWS